MTEGEQQFILGKQKERFTIQSNYIGVSKYRPVPIHKQDFNASFTPTQILT